MVDLNVRGGAELRKRATTLKNSKRAEYACPKTGKTVKRISNSVWKSTGGYTYAGGVYAFSTPAGEVANRMINEHKAKKMAKMQKEKAEQKS